MTNREQELRVSIFFIGFIIGFFGLMALISIGDRKNPSISISTLNKIKRFENEYKVTLTIDSQGRTWLWVPKLKKSVIINIEGNVVF